MSEILRRLLGSAVLVTAPAFAAQETLTIQSAPPGAEVELGGKFVGLTPIALEYPASHFREPATVWGNYLGEPLKVTLRKDGYQTKMVELGDGPHTWTSLDGSNRFEYYLLDTSYTIELEEAAGVGGTQALAAAEAIRTLADLREDGLISDSEFEEKKAELLASISSRSSRRAQYRLSSDIDPNRLCPRLLSSDLPALKAARRAYHKLSASGSGTLHSEASGPVLTCVWTTPFDGIHSMRFEVQCGIENAGASCSSPAPVGSDHHEGQQGALACFLSDDSTGLTAISTSGCFIRAEVAASRAEVGDVLDQVLIGVAAKLE